MHLRNDISRETYWRSAHKGGREPPGKEQRGIYKMGDRVYISGPITGTNDYIYRFKAAERLLRSKGYEVINPVSATENLPDLDYEEYMSIDLALVRICRYIYMLKGWKHSQGAIREYKEAKRAGLCVIEQKDIPGPWNDVEEALPPDDGLVLAIGTGRKGSGMPKWAAVLAAYTENGWVLWKDMKFTQADFTIRQWTCIPEGFQEHWETI